jgi:UDP-N-acetylglucosamine--N-acetylmuramyl-(pentapeptide) pyrophosphoryl-undecaprenol N-acetylglucosamine transferase
MKFLFGAGGTGGHVVPALALADQLRSLGHECVFIGNEDSIEQRLCMQNGYKFHAIKVQKLYRSLKPENLLFPYYLGSSIINAGRIILSEHPSAVICTGGFVSGPVAIAAGLRKVPLFFHESNSYPGLVTRFMQRSISRIYISFESSRNYLRNSDLKKLGIPLQKRDAGDFSLDKIGLKTGVFTILVSGGSQGSLAINLAVEKILPYLEKKGWQLIWQTGSRTHDQFAAYGQNTGIHLFAFSPELPEMLAKADIAITRAGAMTIAELEETHTPAILIPLPTAAENHQYYNALEQHRKGVALLLQQSELSPESLTRAIDTVNQSLQNFKDNLQTLPSNNATSAIVADLLTYLEQKRLSTKPLNGSSKTGNHIAL